MFVILLVALFSLLPVPLLAPALASKNDFTAVNANDSRNKFKLDCLRFIEPPGQDDNKVSNRVKPCPVKGRAHCCCSFYFDEKMPKDTSQIVFTGKDKKGKSWRLTTAYHPGGGVLRFTGDLDGNGVTDIVLLSSIGGCVGVGSYGIVPSNVFTAILFDKDGRPFPWELCGDFGTEDTNWYGKTNMPQIDELIRIGGDKKACLIVERYDFSEGRSYWKTLLYRANDGRWDKLTTYQGHTLPLLVQNDGDPLLVQAAGEHNHKIISPPNKDLSAFEDGSCTVEDEKRCRYGKINSFSIDKNNRQKLNLSCGTYTTTNDYDDSETRFTPFIIHESKSSYELASFGTREAANILRRAALHKARIKYLSSSLARAMPLYLWILN
jgi:hypothetical protein